MDGYEAKKEEDDTSGSGYREKDTIHPQEVFFLRHSIQVNPKTIPNRSQAQTKGVNKSQISFSGSSASPAPITWVSLTNGRIVPSGPVMVALENASFR